MNNRHLLYALAIIVSALQISCAASRNQSPSQIGIVPLPHYAVAGQQSVTDTTYKAFTNNADFMATFNTAPAGAKRPDFNAQIAVAVLLNAPASMQFERAEFIGRKINIYLQTCTSSTNPGCQAASSFVAAIPKVGNAQRVQFYINKEPKMTVGL